MFRTQCGKVDAYVIKQPLMERMYKLLMAAMSGISYHFVMAATRSLELIIM